MRSFTNIIFLDIDGVLNSELFYRSLKTKRNKSRLSKNLDTNAIKLLNELCEDINAKVVISSVWRLNKSIEHLQFVLNDSGATFEIIGKTKSISEARNRGVEVKRWLDDHFADKIYNYVILDDDSDFLLEQREHYFKVDQYCGLTPTITYKVKLFLNKFKPYSPKTDSFSPKPETRATWVNWRPVNDKPDVGQEICSFVDCSDGSSDIIIYTWDKDMVFDSNEKGWCLKNEINRPTI